MTTTEAINVVKVLMKNIGDDPEQDKALAAGCIVLLDKVMTGKVEPEQTEPVKAKQPKAAPKKRPPFDTGKMKALLDGGWPVAKIADEMGYSVYTIYEHMKKEGLAVGKQ